MQPRDGSTPLVTVVIPTYNYAHFVTEAVDSALAQTYPAVEVIVVDDGSTDDTRAVLSRYGDRIRYIYQENGGLSAARNTGIRAAAGELVTFLDSDDAFHPRKVELHVRYMLAHPEVALLAAGAFIDPSEKWPELPPDPLAADPISLDSLVSKNQFGCTVVVWRKYFDEVGYFDENLRSVEDRDMWIRIAARHPIARLRAPLAYIRQHASSMSQDAAKMEHYDNMVLAKAFTLPELARRPLLHRKARSVAAFSAALKYRDTRHHGRAVAAALRSFWLWPLPHPAQYVKPLARLKFLLLMPQFLLRGRPDVKANV
jgi:glycosyltransferase involved in cell wall biosynthesis